jgi:uncharacterized membrane-anchored protein
MMDGTAVNARRGRSSVAGGVPWSKVPLVSAYFWITKVLTTGMGETASDYMVRGPGPGPVAAVMLGAAGFTAALILQFCVRRYVPWVYWLAVTMVSIFGTMAADVLHVGLGVPYEVSTAFFAFVLAALFITWRMVEKTLSFHSIHTPRREAFYWAAVVTTFALGTAVGDLTAVTLHLGYFASGLVFAAALAVPALAYRFLRLGAVPAFWIAYILTRPFGASFADWMAVSPVRGGLNWGAGPVTIVLAALIVGFVVLLALSRRDREPVLPNPHPEAS